MVSILSKKSNFSWFFWYFLNFWDLLATVNHKWKEIVVNLKENGVSVKVEIYIFCKKTTRKPEIYVFANKHKILFYQKSVFCFKLFWNKLFLRSIRYKFSFLQCIPFFVLLHFLQANICLLIFKICLILTFFVFCTVF